MSPSSKALADSLNRAVVSFFFVCIVLFAQPLLSHFEYILGSISTARAVNSTKQLASFVPNS